VVYEVLELYPFLNIYCGFAFSEVHRSQLGASLIIELHMWQVYTQETQYLCNIAVEMQR